MRSKFGKSSLWAEFIKMLGTDNSKLIILLVYGTQ